MLFYIGVTDLIYSNVRAGHGLDLIPAVTLYNQIKCQCATFGRSTHLMWH